MSSQYVVETLAKHDRTAFSCGVEPLDRYLRDQALQYAKRLISGCFVLVDRDSRAIAGYYTLAATSIPTTDLPGETVKRLPRYPSMPAALVGRLAVDQRYRRTGLGGLLLADAALRIMNSEVKALAMVVHAKDRSAVDFYLANGFIPFAGQPLTLFLPLGTLRKAADAT